jgi:murein DD-endopeptidase MepM/ murein hydrolase activator NlpD
MRYLILVASFLLTSIGIFGQRKPLDAFTELSGDAFTLYITNYLNLPVYLEIEPISPGMGVTFDYVESQVIPASERSYTAVIARPITPEDTASFVFGDYFDLSFRMGDPFTASHDKKYRYQLPFTEGNTYKVIQGFKGSYSHNSPSSKYAIDFDLPVGDTICAAREGVVAKVVQHFTEGGRDRKKFYGKDNHIAILHSDGSIGFYVHLDFEGVLVELGEQVEKGQPIGISGNTGWTTRPHLHFVVREPTKKDLIAVPVNFENVKGKSLKKGKKVKR